MRCLTRPSAASSCGRAAGARLAQRNRGWWRSFCRPISAVVSSCCARSSRPARHCRRRRSGRRRKPATSCPGSFDLEVDGVWHRLGEGDSFRFKAKPFRWRIRAPSRRSSSGRFRRRSIEGSLRDFAWLNFQPRPAWSSSAAARSASPRSIIWRRPAGRDCVLLEKNELTSGSTWHAAGNVPTFSSSWALMNMQRYSAELYRGLAEAVDYPMNYHVTGSLRLAHTRRAHARVPARQGHGPLPGHGHRRGRPRRDQGALSLHRDARPQGRALRSERRRHRPGAADAGAGQGRARPRRDDRALLPGDRRPPRQRRVDRRPRRKAKSAANMWSTPPAIAPAKSARCSAATCR